MIPQMNHFNFRIFNINRNRINKAQIQAIRSWSENICFSFIQFHQIHIEILATFKGNFWLGDGFEAHMLEAGLEASWINEIAFK